MSQIGLLEALDMHFDAKMDEIHTTFPGVVVSYDGHKKRTAVIRPSISFTLSNGVLIDAQNLHGVHVIFPFVSQGGLLFPLKKGDKVLVVISESSTGNWRNANTETVDAEDCSRFTLNDAFCIPGLYPTSVAPVPDGFSDDEVWLGRVGKSAIQMGNDGKVSVRNSVSSLKKELDAVWDAIKAINDGLAASTTAVAGVPTPLTNAPVFVQQSVQNAMAKTQMSNFLK